MSPGRAPGLCTRGSQESVDSGLVQRPRGHNLGRSSKNRRMQDRGGGSCQSEPAGGRSGALTAAKPHPTALTLHWGKAESSNANYLPFEINVSTRHKNVRSARNDPSVGTSLPLTSILHHPPTDWSCFLVLSLRNAGLHLVNCELQTQ